MGSAMGLLGQLVQCELQAVVESKEGRCFAGIVVAKFAADLAGILNLDQDLCQCTSLGVSGQLLLALYLEE